MPCMEQVYHGTGTSLNCAPVQTMPWWYMMSNNSIYLYIQLFTICFWYILGIYKYILVYTPYTCIYLYIPKCPLCPCIYHFSYSYWRSWHVKGYSQNVTLRVIEKKNLGAKHCVLSVRWDYKQHRFKDFFFRQHRFRNATLGGISNTRSKERSEAL